MKNQNELQLERIKNCKASLERISPIAVSSGSALILVDVGYLSHVAATYLTDDEIREVPLREETNLRAEDIVATLNTLHARLLPHSDLREIVIYDGARDYGKITQPDHVALAEKDLVRLRLGRVIGNKGQKGVDVLLALDIMKIAVTYPRGDIILLTGDEDLREAVREAAFLGTRIHLVGLLEKGDTPNVSQRLRRECSSFRQFSPAGLVDFKLNEMDKAQEAKVVQPKSPVPALPPPIASARPAMSGIKPIKQRKSRDLVEGRTANMLAEQADAQERRKFAGSLGSTRLAPIHDPDILTTPTQENILRNAISGFVRTLSVTELENVRETEMPKVPAEIDRRLLGCAASSYCSYQQLPHCTFGFNDLVWIRNCFREMVG